MSDADLIRRVRDDRDPDAFEALYLRHSRLAMSCALRLVFERNLAADAVQVAFLDIWRAPANYNPERGPVDAWIAAITCNRAVDILRRAHKQQRVESAVRAEPARAESDATFAGTVVHDEAKRLRQRVGELPDAQREVIELSYLEHLSQREIAKRLSLPLGTVKGRARLGLARLRHQAVSGR